MLTSVSQTYTISSLEEMISRDIFPAAKSYAESHFPNTSTPSHDVYKFGISLYELLGNKATDLLDRDEEGNGVTVEVAEDKVRPLPRIRLTLEIIHFFLQFGGIRVSAKVVTISDPKELASSIASAAGHRRTSATLKNEKSSRS
jgi:hypothetical protein